MQTRKWQKVTGILLLLFLCMIVSITFVVYRKERLNTRMIGDIEARKYAAALDTLNAGADASAVKRDPDNEPSVIQKLRDAINWPTPAGQTADTYKPFVSIDVLYGLANTESRLDAPAVGVEEDTFQRLAVKLIESGALDRHPDNLPMLFRQIVSFHHHRVLDALLRRHPESIVAESLLDADAIDTRTLLSHGINVETTDRNSGRSAVFFALPDKLDVLHKHGANLLARDKDGSTPLMIAARKGMDASVIRLIEQGADVKARDTGKFTATLWACESCSLETIQKLVVAGGDVRAVGFGGTTAIMLALVNDDLRVIPWLQAQGVNINSRNSNGQTALDLAILDRPRQEAGSSRVVSMLRSHGAAY